MVETEGVCIYGAQNVGVLYHGEMEAPRNRSQHGVVYGQGPAGELESLEFDPRQVKSGNSAFAECSIVRQQNIGIRSQAVHQELGVEKLEGGL